ncbi:MAG: molybdenum cofactor biosynthesis F family protein [Clostridiales bacterium]|jgi:hypothetical protein|nr:molybdenum cofactor biosynthesis F family protein [Clostridiales bacterium]
MAVYTYPQFSEEEIDRIVKNTTVYNQGGLASSRPPFYEDLAGKKYNIKYDNGFEFDYQFADAHKLYWKDTSGELKEEYYEALQADEHVILVVHIVKNTSPQQARMIVLEMNTGLVTTFFCKIGNEVSAREVDRDIVFGYFSPTGESPESPESTEFSDSIKPTAARHSLTTNLVGRSIIWTYSPTFSIQHIYASKWYSAFVDFNSFYGGMLLSSPCNYVEINDHVYIYSWVETEGAGVQGFALMNLFDMHDVGCFFGINGDSKFECYTFGAIGKDVGQLTNLHLPNEMDKDFDWPPKEREEGATE